MKLVELSERYADFYAPGFAIFIGGVDLVRGLEVAVSQIDVDLVKNEASHFSFTLANCYNGKKHQFETGSGQDLLEVLTLAQDVKVCLGYRDLATMPATILGKVTKIETSFPEAGSPELVVSGYDHGFPLTLGRSSLCRKDRKDSELVQEIASKHHLASVIDDTPEKHPQIEQNQQNDWELLKALAKRNSSDKKGVLYEVFVDNDPAGRKPTLYFGRPRVDSASVATLEWGAGLLSFKPDANLAGQVAKVEVHGWDVANKRPIVGRANADAMADARGKSISQHLGKLVHAPDRQPTLAVRQPVFTQAEADKRAQAAIGDISKKFLTGEAESIGLPELRPDRTVEFTNLGKEFSKLYYIEHASHHLDSNGYRTRFNVREAKR
jgi:uncharacterized protein